MAIIFANAKRTLEISRAVRTEAVAPQSAHRRLLTLTADQIAALRWLGNSGGYPRGELHRTLMACSGVAQEDGFFWRTAHGDFLLKKVEEQERQEREEEERRHRCECPICRPVAVNQKALLDAAAEQLERLASDPFDKLSLSRKITMRLLAKKFRRAATQPASESNLAVSQPPAPAPKAVNPAEDLSPAQPSTDAERLRLERRIASLESQVAALRRLLERAYAQKPSEVEQPKSVGVQTPSVAWTPEGLDW
jgi:hypothetical protein